MSDLYSSVIVVATAVFTLAIQIILCLKVKSTLIKLIPIAVTGILTVIFYLCCIWFDGWDVIGYLLLMLFSGGLLLLCSLCFMIFAIINAVRKKKGNRASIDEENTLDFK